jgi:sugar-phosphatase
MISASDINKGKPAPEPYLKAAAALNYSPRDCVVIEDAPAGVLSGKAAGMRVIAVPTTYPIAKLKDADFLIRRLSDLRVTTANTAGRQAIHLEILLPESSSR